MRKLEQLKSKTRRPTLWSGLPDACLERAGLREDRDLHCEAWVLVTRATDTLYRAEGKTPLQNPQTVEAFSTKPAKSQTRRKDEPSRTPRTCYKRNSGDHQARRTATRPCGEEETSRILGLRMLRKAATLARLPGMMHIGTGLVCGTKIKDMIQAGFHFIIFLADWHSMINNKFGGDMEKIENESSESPKPSQHNEPCEHCPSWAVT